MDKEAILEKITNLGLLAVLRGPSPELTIKMVDALVKGGVLGIEITFSTSGSYQGGVQPLISGDGEFFSLKLKRDVTRDSLGCNAYATHTIVITPKPQTESKLGVHPAGPIVFEVVSCGTTRRYSIPVNVIVYSTTQAGTMTGLGTAVDGGTVCDPFGCTFKLTSGDLYTEITAPATGDWVVRIPSFTWSFRNGICTFEYFGPSSSKLVELENGDNSFALGTNPSAGTEYISGCGSTGSHDSAYISGGTIAVTMYKVSP